MRVKELHPLCCITLETPATTGDNSPEPSFGGSCLSRTGSVKYPPPLPPPQVSSTYSDATGSDTTAAAVGGILFKWTNYGKGWRCRWFYLRSGVLSYSKIGSPDCLGSLPGFQDVRVIGEISTASARLSRMDSCGRRKAQTASAVVHLKVASFRESRSDDKKFYIFTATRTLHLRTNSKTERAAWIEALASCRGLFSLRPLSHHLSLSSPNSLSVSTERLKIRLVDEGVNESVVKECEQIMLSEFSEMQGQLKAVYEERSSLLDMLRQVEATNIEEGSSSGAHDRDYQKNEYTSVTRGKYSECSTTESSDDVEKQDSEEVSDEEEHSYYDTKDCFVNSPSSRTSSEKACECLSISEQHTCSGREIQCKEKLCGTLTERRTKLPDPAEKEKAVGLWSLIKDNVGKDLTRVCLPVYFNEPISSLQKCCEDLEYSYLLDRAYECGKVGDSLGRVANIAAFAISGYASSEGRHCKPFNPLLGETYEADFPERGIRFFSEKVSHHPTVIACHCEGRGWRFWGDSNLKAKFWGQSIQLDPVGTLNLEFDDGEVFQWSKVTTSICNLILGKIYCDHHGTMDIRGNRQHSCAVKFKAQSFLDRNPRQVQGIIEDVSGRKLGMIVGKWDDSLYLVQGDGNGKVRDQNANTSLLWTRSKPPVNLTRYNLTSFAITLNELTPGLQEILPPTDSRLRPDQRHLENGEYEKANTEKLRLELRQRAARKIQEDGWRPKWFTQDEDGPYHFSGGYWEAREQRKWDRCPDIFGEFYEDQSI